MKIVIGLFAVAAVFGLCLAVRHFAKKENSTPLALLHGLFAASGLVALICFLLRTGFAGLPLAALAILIVAALGGFVLFAMHLKGRRLFSPLVVIHALAAVGAFGLLLYGLMR